MHDIGCEHADVWSCSGNTYLLEPRIPAGAATRRRVSELEQVGVGRPAGRGGRGRLRVAVVLAVRHGVSKTVERLPLTVQDLTTQASNEFITSYLQAQPRLAAIQADFGDWALGAANAVRQAHSKAIVVSASGDPTEYQEMAKSSPYEEVAICR